MIFVTFGLGWNCINGSVSLNCYGHSIAVLIGSCCNVSVNNLENHDDYG